MERQLGSGPAESFEVNGAASRVVGTGASGDDGLLRRAVGGQRERELTSDQTLGEVKCPDTCARPVVAIATAMGSGGPCRTDTPKVATKSGSPPPMSLSQISPDGQVRGCIVHAAHNRG